MAKKSHTVILQQHKPRIFSAERSTDGSGKVYRLLELTEAEAIRERKAGRDILVCGNDFIANKNLAKSIEMAVGPYIRSPMHESAGPSALAHFQPATRPPEGHSFYETKSGRSQRKRP